MRPSLHIAAIVPSTASEGPHRRWATWVRGCSLRCPGCCNPELFATGVHEPTAVEALLVDLEAARTRFDLEGITILGGEPLEQLAGVTALAAGAQGMGLGVIVFTGYTRSEARGLRGFARLWAAIDTLVDGRFDGGRLDHTRRIVGSTNQQLYHRTDRYRSPALWQGHGGAEVRIDSDGSVSLHGDPQNVRRILRQLR